MIPLRDENPTRRVPWVTWLLIAVNVAVYFGIQQVELRPVRETVAFNLEHAAIPCELIEGEPLSVAEIETGRCDAEGGRVPFPHKSVWLSVLFSMFMHGSILHLGGNMLFLWIFGNNIEDHLGHLRYIVFYVAAGVVATLTHVAFNLDSTIPLVGASGAIAGVMGAYLVWFPNAPIRTLVTFFFIFFVDIEARWLLIFWFISQFFIDPNSGVASMAHVGGFVFGVVVAWIVRADERARRALWAGSDAGWTPGGWDPTGGAGRGPYRDWRR